MAQFGGVKNPPWVRDAAGSTLKEFNILKSKIHVNTTCMQSPCYIVPNDGYLKYFPIRPVD